VCRVGTPRPVSESRIVTRSLQSARLVLFVDAGPGAVERIGAACGASAIAAVVIRTQAVRGDRALVASAIDTIRRHGALALIEDDVALARACSADGVHLSASIDIEERYRHARADLGREATIGIDAGASRHDAMTTAEEGADYVAFGLAPSGSDADQAAQARADLIAWWSQVFEPPCVALDVAAPQEAADLADAGADFIAFSIPTGRSAAEVAEFAMALAAALVPIDTENREARTLS
jgi:thiamine-phosphate pyrophosphorylase